MRLAAGLTVSGILGLLLLEALKMLMPTLTIWMIGLLTFALKALLILVALFIAIGVCVFLYTRHRKVTAEVA
jgi:type II secretory pathway component PulF